MPTCRFTMDYWRDGSWYVGRLREVPGVFSQGKTLAELDENLRDAYRLVLRDQQPIRRRGVRRKALAFAVWSPAIPKSLTRLCEVIHKQLGLS